MRSVQTAFLLISLTFVVAIASGNQPDGSNLNTGLLKEEKIIDFPRNIISESDEVNPNINNFDKISESNIGPPLEVENDNENDNENENEQDFEIQTSSRRLLRKRGFKKAVHKVKKAVHKVKKAVHKIFKKNKSPVKSSQVNKPKHSDNIKLKALCKNNKEKCGKNIKTAAIERENKKKLDAWLLTQQGRDATKFCMGLGIFNKPRIFQGCLEDVMVTKSKKIAKESAITAEEFLAKNKVSSSRRFCTASGDPHFTNYDGSYFHLQEPGIYTLAKTNGFEVQEKMRKNGANRPGVPSCLTGAAVKFGDNSVEFNVDNFNQIIVNGQPTRLQHNKDNIYGNIHVRYGNQRVEWRGKRSSGHGLKITVPNGFGVMIFGGYCGVVEVNVPEQYFGKMHGICGNADGSRDRNDFKDPSGSVMNVNYGARRWEMSGYGGPNAPLSRWQLAWKPTGSDCFFRDGCERDSPVVAARREERRKKREERKLAEIAIRIKKLKKEEEIRETEEKRLKEEVRKAEERRRKEQERLRKEAERVERNNKDQSREEREKRESDLVREVKRLEGRKKKERERKRKEKENKKKIKKIKKKILEEEEKLDNETGKVDESSRSKNKKKNKNKKKGFKKLMRDMKLRKRFSFAKLTKISQKIIGMMNDNRKKHLEEMDRIKTDLSFSKKAKTDAYKNYNNKNKKLISLKVEVNRLKKIMKKHFNQMNFDSSYLKKLRLMKPKFLATLERYNKQVGKIRSSISTNIVNGDDKDFMLKLVGEADKHTRRSTDNLAKAFLDHYSKFKNLKLADRNVYNKDRDALAKKKEELKQYKREVSELKKQYKNARNLVKKLRKTFKLSKEENDSFDSLMQLLNVMLKNPSKSKQFLEGKCGK